VGAFEDYPVWINPFLKDSLEAKSRTIGQKSSAEKNC